MFVVGLDWLVSMMDLMQIIQMGVMYWLIDQLDSLLWNLYEWFDLFMMFEVYMVNIVYVLCFDDCMGLFEVGKDVSFVIFDCNLFVYLVEMFVQVCVIEMCFCGEVVYVVLGWVE